MSAIIRLASRAAVLALCAAGTPALAHEPMQPSEPTLEQARHDRDAVTADWPLARALALKLSAGGGLLADDLTEAIERGDQAVALAARAETTEAIEASVYAALAAIAHIVNQMPRPSGA